MAAPPSAHTTRHNPLSIILRVGGEILNSQPGNYDMPFYFVLNHLMCNGPCLACPHEYVTPLAFHTMPIGVANGWRTKSTITHSIHAYERLSLNGRIVEWNYRCGNSIFHRVRRTVLEIHGPTINVYPAQREKWKEVEKKEKRHLGVSCTRITDSEEAIRQ